MAKCAAPISATYKKQVKSSASEVTPQNHTSNVEKI